MYKCVTYVSLTYTLPLKALAYRKTVLVENIKGYTRTTLRATFLALFRDQVDAVEIVPDTARLDALIADRLTLLKKVRN